MLLTCILSLASMAPAAPPSSQTVDRPNLVILYADDLGYGDLGCYGHPTIRTPNLDRMAAEGLRFTQFYSAAPVCTPSRAALMTGRLPIRNGMCDDRVGVLFPDSTGGIQPEEITLAEALKRQGYATACVGKWHLGHLPQYLPTKHGFDEYLGLPYSNDMKPTPLILGEEEIEEPAVQETLTPRYTLKAVDFIRRHREGPFFLYLAYTFPHVPLHTSDAFRDKSLRGLYGDVVEEIDWSVGEVLRTLRDSGLAERTLVFFSSDNGPWLIKKLDGGSAGLLRDGKGTTWEGGMREPGIAWWPGTVKAGTVTAELAGTMDLFTTFITLAGGTVPADRTIDGLDIRPVLLGTGPSPRKEYFYYHGTQLAAARLGPFKAHFMTWQSGVKGNQQHDPPLLFNIEQDPSETVDLAKDNPDVLARIKQAVEQHRAGVVPAPSQLADRTGKKNK